MIVDKERIVEPLKDLDEKIYFDALKENKLDTYENEIAIFKGALSIPKEIIELPIQAQNMLSFYNDRQWVNPQTGKHTYNDIVECYIASLDDTEFMKDVFFFEKVRDEQGNVIDEVVKINPEQKAIYMKLKTYAISYWNDNNLSQIVDVFKTLMLGGRKQEDMLKDAVIDDALYHKDMNYKMKNRTLAVKVLGMDKNVKTDGQDVVNDGKKIFGVTDEYVVQYSIGKI